MQLTPVESSHVAAIGYLEDERVLLVRYRDGALYAMAGWQPRDYELMIAASSKGRFLQNVVIGKPILISKKGEHAVNSSTPEQSGPPSTSGPLNVIDEDADKCCVACLHLHNETPRTDPCECSECGTQFYPEMVGGVRHWRIVPQVHIVRK